MWRWAIFSKNHSLLLWLLTIPRITRRAECIYFIDKNNRWFARICTGWCIWKSFPQNLTFFSMCSVNRMWTARQPKIIKPTESQKQTIQYITFAPYRCNSISLQRSMEIMQYLRTIKWAPDSRTIARIKLVYHCKQNQINLKETKIIFLPFSTLLAIDRNSLILEKKLILYISFLGIHRRW